MGEGRQLEQQPTDSGRSWGSITVQFGVSSIVLVIGLIVVAYLLFRIPHFWLIVIAALVLATAMDKPVSAMQALGMPRGLGILLIYVLLIVLLVGALAALAPVVRGDAHALEGELPRYIDRLEQAAGSMLSGESPAFSLASLEDQVRAHAGSLAQGATDVGLEIGRSAFYVFVTLVVAFFLAAEPEMMTNALRRFVPPRHQPRATRIAKTIHESIGAWARGQLLIAVIFGALMGTGLRLLGVPYAWSLGVVAGILEVVPYVGGAITVVLAVFSAATVGIPQILGVIVLYVILVNIESHILAPLLYGRALGLPPVAILLALLAGVELLGILGALLAVPLTVILWAIAAEFAPPRGQETASEVTPAAK